MSEYTIFKNSFGGDCLSNPSGVTIAIAPVGEDYEKWRKLLNQETAPLHEEIATLQAALEESQRALATANHYASVATATAAKYEAALKSVFQLSLDEIEDGNEPSEKYLNDRLDIINMEASKALSLIDYDYELTPKEIARAEQVASETVGKDGDS